MTTFTEMVDKARRRVGEIYPWDLAEKLASSTDTLILDVRERDEFETMHIPNSINIPRGLLEMACDWGYDETLPALAEARDQEIVVVCRSGNRSLLGAVVMKEMGYSNISSLGLGLRGWKDDEQSLVDLDCNPVDLDDADLFFAPKVTPEQLGPSA